jgi:RsiW-degrading membrane proteinase PrsW (M82 family)
MNLLLGLQLSAPKTVIVLCAVVAVACIDIVRRMKHRPSHLFFATVLGTAVTIGLIRTIDLFLQPDMQGNSYLTGLAVVLVLLGWRALFGPWEVQTKLTILGTCLFWICLRLFRDDSPQELSIRLIAVGSALIPAVIWCVLFLKYHRERLASVLLLFMAGMLSTVPILFYDLLVRRGAEMQFFFFTLKPENFNQVARSFVSMHMAAEEPLTMLLAGTFLSFFFVGLIEELSKYWVVNRCGRGIFTSIDDVMQLSIMVAIGFAFAENIVNPVYFTAFVSEYLMHDAAPDVASFLGNVLGRSVLTSMVHIVSTGVMGYFLGLALYANPVLAQRHANGSRHLFLHLLRRLLRLPEASIYRIEMLATGLLSAILLHGLFNFLVTLPEILPGNPQSVAEALGDTAPAFLEHIPLLLLPAMFYVVGGFWLLTWLFMRADGSAERGHRVMKEAFVEIVEEE